MKVILLNQNPAVSRLIKLSLEKIGAKLEEIEDLKQVEPWSCDVFICDHEMAQENVDYTPFGKEILFLIPRNYEKKLGKNTLEKPFLPTDFIDLIQKLSVGSKENMDEASSLNDETISPSADLNDSFDDTLGQNDTFSDIGNDELEDFGSFDDIAEENPIKAQREEQLEELSSMVDEIDNLSDTEVENSSENSSDELAELAEVAEVADENSSGNADDENSSDESEISSDDFGDELAEISEVTDENSSEVTDENSSDESEISSDDFGDELAEISEVTDENSSEVTDENSSEVTDENSSEVTDESDEVDDERDAIFNVEAKGEELADFDSISGFVPPKDNERNDADEAPSDFSDIEEDEIVENTDKKELSKEERMERLKAEIEEAGRKTAQAMKEPLNLDNNDISLSDAVSEALGEKQEEVILAVEPSKDDSAGDEEMDFSDVLDGVKEDSNDSSQEQDDSAGDEEMDFSDILDGVKDDNDEQAQDDKDNQEAELSSSELAQMTEGLNDLAFNENSSDESASDELAEVSENSSDESEQIDENSSDELSELAEVNDENISDEIAEISDNSSDESEQIDENSSDELSELAEVNDENISDEIAEISDNSSDESTDDEFAGLSESDLASALGEDVGQVESKPSVNDELENAKAQISSKITETLGATLANSPELKDAIKGMKIKINISFED